MKRFVEVQEVRNGQVQTKIYPARRVGAKREVYDVEWQCFQVPGESWAECVDDMRCCEGCGYAVCSCAPPPPKVTPPMGVLPEGWTLGPVVPDYYTHKGGAAVCRSKGRESPSDGRECWFWYAPEEWATTPEAAKPTRDAAMAAALASVQPAPCFRCGAVGESMAGGAGCCFDAYGCNARRRALASATSITVDLTDADLAGLSKGHRRLEVPQPELRHGWGRCSSDDNDRYILTDTAHIVYRRDEGFDRDALPWRLCGYSNHPTLLSAMLRAEQLADLEGSR